MSIDFWDEQAEQMLLSAVLQKPHALDEISVSVSQSDFFHAIHQNLFGLMQSLYGKSRLDWKAVLEMVREDPERYGETDYIAELRGALHTHYLIPHYCEKVILLSTKRKMLEIASILMRMANEDEFENADAYIAAAHEQMQRLDTAQKSEAVYLHEAIPKHIDTILQGEREQSPVTGFSDIDIWMRGLGRNRLIILAGRPGAGKTATALKIGREVAKQDFGPTIFISMEMSKGELMDRMVADAATVPFADIQGGTLDDAQKKSLIEAKQKLSGFNFIIDDKSRVDAAYLAAQCRNYKRKHGKLGLVIIDYLGLMDDHQKKGQSKSDAIGKLTRELKLLPKEIGCSILLLCQMNRELEKRRDKRPIMSDLRDSGSIEQDADTVIFLYREEDEKQDNPNIPEVDFIVAKGRQTGTKDFKLRFHGKIQRMETKFR